MRMHDIYETEGLTWEEWERLRVFITRWKDRVRQERSVSAMCHHVKYHVRFMRVPDCLVAEMLRLCGVIERAEVAA